MPKQVLTEAQKQAKREYNRQYHKDNKDSIKARREKYLTENPEKKAAYEANNKLNMKNYYVKNKEAIGKRTYNYTKKRVAIDPLYKFTRAISKLIYSGLKRKGLKKNTKTSNILGCTIAEFRTYLESKFEAWMSWDNKGLYNGQPNYGWDIDHVIPISSAVTNEDVIKLNHYTNLQPLCSYINRDVKKDN